mmetsp:Transcript_9840/g.26210  ORF Transcript_9840/g.26210 Transcript_9840/m.26210 type:complete len:234 (+) Transcript_9840:46-747(+)
MRDVGEREARGEALEEREECEKRCGAARGRRGTARQAMELSLDLDEDALVLERDFAECDGEDADADDDAKGLPRSGAPGGGGFALSVDELTVVPAATQNAALQAFARCDEDGDGCVTSAQLVQVLAELGYHDGEIVSAVREQSHAKMDAEAMLCVLRALVRAADPSDQSTRIRRAFDHVDIDGNGVLDFDEFRLLLTMIGRGMTDDAARELFDRMDADKSNSIDYDEFVSSVL